MDGNMPSTPVFPSVTRGADTFCPSMDTVETPVRTVDKFNGR